MVLSMERKIKKPVGKYDSRQTIFGTLGNVKIMLVFAFQFLTETHRAIIRWTIYLYAGSARLPKILFTKYVCERSKKMNEGSLR